MNAKCNKKQPGSNRENQSENIPPCPVADGDGAASWTLKTLYTRFDLCFAEFHVRVVCVLLWGSAQLREFATVSLSFVCGTCANQVQWQPPPLSMSWASLPALMCVRTLVVMGTGYHEQRWWAPPLMGPRTSWPRSDQGPGPATDYTLRLDPGNTGNCNGIGANICRKRSHVIQNKPIASPG